MNILIKNGRIIDPATRTDQIGPSLGFSTIVFGSSI